MLYTPSCNISVGIDLDNTIIDYRDLFVVHAQRLHYQPHPTVRTKLQVKEWLSTQEDGNNLWHILQSSVYSEGITFAQIMMGFPSFVDRCRTCNIPLFIVSQKSAGVTMRGERVDLKQPALSWLEKHRFFEDPHLGFNRTDIYLENSLQAKLARVRELNCSYFIDDLPQVLIDPTFPNNTLPILFERQPTPNMKLELPTFGSWAAITDFLLPRETSA